MKKFTLILGLALSLMALEGFSSDLNLRLFNNSTFCVELDNQLYANFTSSFMVSNLQAGNHYLVVYKTRNFRNGRNNGSKILFSGYVNIPMNTKISAMIDNRNRFIVTSEVTYNNRGNNANNDRNNKGNNQYGYNDHNNGRNNNGNGRNEHNDRNNGKGNNNYGTNNNMMSPADFASLKLMISNTAFESSKLGIAENALLNYNFTSAQVLEILYLFSFESTKLDFAKRAYIKVIDRERYFTTYSAFSFSSSIDEMNRYINGF